MATTCVYDEAVYNVTGNGGRCEDCTGNTTGVNCELCQDGYHRHVATELCVPCQCDQYGSAEPRCDDTGRCECKGDIIGEKCDQCPTGYFDLGPDGCRRCACSVSGTVESERDCPTGSDQCMCKNNVEGAMCDKCKMGFYALDSSNPDGCFRCFCHRHSSNCTRAQGYHVQEVTSDFRSGIQGWTTVDQSGRNQQEPTLEFNPRERTILLKSSTDFRGRDYLQASPPFLGKKRLSHRLHLHFVLRIGGNEPEVSQNDLIIEGNGYRVMCAINAQGNPLPANHFQRYKFRLSAGDGWEPNLSDEVFPIMMSNLTSIRIRGSFSNTVFTELTEVRMEYARYGSRGQEAIVEKCACPDGYTGDSCDTCAPGYHRRPAHDDPMARCVPCDCNGHADICDAGTGSCQCKHFTTGERCDRCLSGYYGNARYGNQDDCQKCPCPFDGECVVTRYNDIICTNCRQGYTGKDCTYCMDGYYGDPQARHYIIARPCRKCDCNNNIDPNSVGYCDTLTGTCNQCTFNTTGDHCESCLPGFLWRRPETP